MGEGEIHSSELKNSSLGVETPGMIRCYEKGVLTSIEEFKGPGIPEKGDETLRIPLGSLLLDDEPGTELGLDMYVKLPLRCSPHGIECIRLLASKHFV